MSQEKGAKPTKADAKPEGAKPGNPAAKSADKPAAKPETKPAAKPETKASPDATVDKAAKPEGKATPAADKPAPKAAPEAAAGGKATAKGGKATAKGGKATAKGGKATGGKATGEGKAPAKPEPEPEPKPIDEPYQANPKPNLSDEQERLLALRAAKKAKQPAFRRHEWWRYKDLGGKGAPWRKPQGIHSKARRHFKYRPPIVSIGYRGPAAVRGLHPSGFEEVLVHRPEDLSGLDAKRQAARIGGTVGGRKAGLIQKKADEMGIHVLNRRST